MAHHGPYHLTKMTILTTSLEETMATRTGRWAVADAKARLSEVIARALADGPQTITRRGRETVVVVSAEEWARKTKRGGNLAQFFAASPLPGSGIELERTKDRPRDIEL